MDLLRLRQPVGVGGAGRGRDLVAFRPEMVLGRGGTPDAHVVCCLDDLGHPTDGILVALTVPPDGAERGPFLFVAGRDDGVHDGDGLEHGASSGGLAEVGYQLVADCARGYGFVNLWIRRSVAACGAPDPDHDPAFWVSR